MRLQPVPGGDPRQGRPQPGQLARPGRGYAGCARPARAACPRPRPRGRRRPGQRRRQLGPAPATSGGSSGLVSRPSSHSSAPYWPSTSRPGTESRPPSRTTTSAGRPVTTASVPTRPASRRSASMAPGAGARPVRVGDDRREHAVVVQRDERPLRRRPRSRPSPAAPAAGPAGCPLRGSVHVGQRTVARVAGDLSPRVSGGRELGECARWDAGSGASCSGSTSWPACCAGGRGRRPAADGGRASGSASRSARSAPIVGPRGLAAPGPAAASAIWPRTGTVAAVRHRARQTSR